MRRKGKKRSYSTEKRVSARTWKIVGVAAALVVAVAVLVVVLSVTSGTDTTSSGKPATSLKIKASEAFLKELDAPIRAYREANPKLVMAYDDQDPNVIVSDKEQPGYRSVRVVVSEPCQLKAGTRTLKVNDGIGFYLLYKDGSSGSALPGEVEALGAFLRDFYEKRPTVTFNAVGDIIPGRTVAKMQKLRGVDFPYKMAAPYLNTGDVVYGKLECPLTDRVAAPTKGLTFAAPSNTVQGLKMLGLKVVGLANNHSTNFGRAAFEDTLRVLKENNILFCGGGVDYEAAHKPAVVDAKGVRFSFLDYNTISGSLDATGSEPGVAWISIPPWKPTNEAQIERMEQDIKAARQQSDFVVVSFHWSKEDVYEPSGDMKSLARRAIDAGADMVLGGHPHTVQPIEFYKGRFIAYSMGNFIFDQMQRDQTREGYFIRCTFKGDDPVSIEMVPYRIFDFAQPIVFQGNSGQPLLDRILDMSGVK